MEMTMATLTHTNNMAFIPRIKMSKLNFSNLKKLCLLAEIKCEWKLLRGK